MAVWTVLVSRNEIGSAAHTKNRINDPKELKKIAFTINYHFEGLFPDRFATLGVGFAGPVALVGPDDGLEDEHQRRPAELLDVDAALGVGDDGVLRVAPPELHVRIGRGAADHSRLVHKVGHGFVRGERERWHIGGTVAAGRAGGGRRGR